MNFHSPLVLLILVGCITLPTISQNPIADVVCSLVDCGEGSCKASNQTLLGYDCDCFPGWTKPVVGPITFPSCIFPNCTINLGCTDSPSPSPSSAKPTHQFVPHTLLACVDNSLCVACSTIWCGDGFCLTNGTSYTCQCNEGSSNLNNSTSFPCMKPCAFGSDCNYNNFIPKIPFLFPAITPTSPKSPSPNSPPLIGSKEGDKNCGVMNQNLLTLLPLIALFLFWI